MIKNKWDIWMAKVAFEDEPNKVKERPVLILEDGTAYTIVLKITSKEKRNEKEYQILKWKEAGLSKPSTIRIGKRLQLFDSDFTRRLGKLSAYDIIEVTKKMRKY